jgi:lysophospholipase
MSDLGHQKWEMSRLVSPVDGTLIRFGVFNQKPDTKRAIVFSNGRTEWIEKYSEFFFQDLNIPSDCMVVALDHRGQGDSEGQRAHVASYDHFASDLAAVVQKACPNLPYDLMCHSMGSLIGVYASLKGLMSPERIICTGPLFGLPNFPVPRLVARPLASLLFRVGAGSLATGAANHDKVGFEKNDLTTDRRKWQMICANPFPVPGPTFGWVHATFEACDMVFDDVNLSKLPCPVMILEGKLESVVDGPAISRWVSLAKKRSSFKVSHEAIPAGKHELFFEGGDAYQLVLQASRRFLNFEA